MADSSLLVINTGSSSIKFATYRAAGPGDPQRGFEGLIEGLRTRPRVKVEDAEGRLQAEEDLGEEEPLHWLLDWLSEHPDAGRPAAVGHRVVFGGAAYRAPALVDAALLATLDGLVPMMPLHLPGNLAPIRALLERDPDLPQVACFDTAFHADMPRIARLFGLPRALEHEGLVRYGFHGLSYEYIASVLGSYDPAAAAGRTVVAHLGSGASLCALSGGRSIASTMGFSALDGLVMGTRPGQLDPGVLLYLVREKGMDAPALERLLYKESGLLGLSGISNDMRDLEASEAPDAKEAIQVFCYRIAREIGSLAAALGGLDALVFTAGIGEHSPPVRARVMELCAWLGLTADAAANAAGGPRISGEGSRVSAWVIPTDEDLTIARHTRDLIGS